MSPNRLEEEVYWSHSFSDLKSLISVKSQYETAKLNQQYENLVLVAKAVFGGEGGNAEVIDSVEAAMALNEWG
jgi:hypothetical protein